MTPSFAGPLKSAIGVIGRDTLPGCLEQTWKISTEKSHVRTPMIHHKQTSQSKQNTQTPSSMQMILQKKKQTTPSIWIVVVPITCLEINKSSMRSTEPLKPRLS
jgi:hypothetical protein